MTRPNGTQIVFDWQVETTDDGMGGLAHHWRLGSIANSHGYKIDFDYPICKSGFPLTDFLTTQVGRFYRSPSGALRRLTAADSA